MNKFKTGDEVWFFYTDAGRNSWPHATIVNAYGLSILKGIIVSMNEDKDYVHVYVKGEKDIVEFGNCFIEENIYPTKKIAIESLRNKLDKF